MRKVPPKGYNKKEAKSELEKYEYSNIPDDKKVNVIAIMLEAYSDLSDAEGIEFKIDPYRKWHVLESQSYSGDLITNIFAGGTIDTERKFLTGATNLPTLRKKTNSYVYYFKEQGYTVEGSHPSSNFFYNRVNINKNLGFDNYYFLENKYENLLNAYFIRDNILLDEITKLYKENKNTSKPYFSFNVTYQNHGPYPTEDVYHKQYIERKKGYTTEEYNILNSYFWGIEDTNNAIYDMIQELKQDDEPVVCILFGDHKPWLGNGGSVYTMLGMDMNSNTQEGAKNYYSTPYIIWANDRAKEVLNNEFIGTGEDISPNFLMNKFFELAGYDGNEYMKFTNEVFDKINVINTDFYYQNGEFTKELTEENKKLLEKFNKVQYYQMNEFKNK